MRKQWNCLLFLLLVMWHHQPQVTAQLTHTRSTAPTFQVQPEKEVFFSPYQAISLPCVAKGIPDPVYSWKKNGQDFDPSSDLTVGLGGQDGTLTFSRPLASHEGWYQCVASNNMGTAVTVQVHFRKAYLEPFEQAEVKYYRPQLGHPQTLPCVLPDSLPAPHIYWALTDPGFDLVEFTDRITMDPNGNLHFANVRRGDSQEGRRYTCVVQNPTAGYGQAGAYAVIEPQGQYIQNMRVSVLWQPPVNQMAIKGETWRVKCIMSGSPTPRIDWERVNGRLPENARTESYGQELVVQNVQFEDAGSYECMGINDEMQLPVRRSMELQVESKPWWRQAPESVDASEDGSTAVFRCEAEGRPEPQTHWFLNGKPISELPEDPKRIVDQGTMTFVNLTLGDSLVIQCNASNVHGYIFANAYLRVVRELPQISTPFSEQKAAEDQTVTLYCHVTGFPKPTVTWTKAGEALIGGRYNVTEESHLEIQNTSVADSGNYTCAAVSQFGSAEATRFLVVRRRTRIVVAPSDTEAVEGEMVKLSCVAVTDDQEEDNLKIDWKFRGNLINFAPYLRVFKTEHDNALTIFPALSFDSGLYTCVASNGIDVAEAHAYVTIRGIPDPPYSIDVQCHNYDRTALVEWGSSRDNNSPILSYIVQYNTSFSPSTWVDMDSHIPGSERSRWVELSPWANYTFRVLARNAIGKSYPSQHTQQVCSTPPETPTTNPKYVRVEGDRPHNLVISWASMPKIEQNAEGFKYIVTYKRMDVSDAWEESYTIDRPDAWYQVIGLDYDVPAYTPYEASVKASNSIGDSTASLEKVRGYSGEDIPEEAPYDVTVIEESINETSAKLVWTAVDESPELIHGYFRGYRIEFWEIGGMSRNRYRIHDMILNDPDYYQRPRNKRQAQSDITFTIRGLPPNSTVIAQVRVLNKYYAGPASNQVSFTTLEEEVEELRCYSCVTTKVDVSNNSYLNELQSTFPYNGACEDVDDSDHIEVCARKYDQCVQADFTVSSNYWPRPQPSDTSVSITLNVTRRFCAQSVALNLRNTCLVPLENYVSYKDYRDTLWHILDGFITGGIHGEACSCSDNLCNNKVVKSFENLRTTPEPDITAPSTPETDSDTSSNGFNSINSGKIRVVLKAGLVYLFITGFLFIT